MKKSLLLGSLLLTTSGGLALLPHSPATSELNSPAKVAIAEQLVAQAPDSEATTDNITVLDYGAAERTALRYAPTAGSTQRTKIRMATDMAMTFDGQAIPNFSIPALEFIIDFTVNKIDDDGAIHSTFTYVDIKSEPTQEIPPSLAEAQRKQFDALKGATGTIVFDNRGNLKDFDFQFPESGGPSQQRLFDQLSQSIKQISNILPADAVGVGAQWQAPQSIAFGGINIEQTATYTLKDFQDNVMQLDVSVTQAATTSADGIEGLPAGVKATINSLNTTGQGQLSQNLGQVMPTTLSMETATQMEVGISSGEKQSVMNADINMALTQSAE